MIIKLFGGKFSDFDLNIKFENVAMDDYLVIWW
jgi:hypothetical protein